MLEVPLSSFRQSPVNSPYPAAMAGPADITATAAMMSALKRMFLSIFFVFQPRTTPGQRKQFKSCHALN
jgi:hypothetical protein